MMKVFIVIIASILLVSADSQERKDCEIAATPTFTLKYGEAFAIPEACLLIKCRGGQTFDISSNCPTLLRGAPSDVAVKKSKEMGDKIVAGEACKAISVI